MKNHNKNKEYYEEKMLWMLRTFINLKINIQNWMSALSKRCLNIWLIKYVIFVDIETEETKHAPSQIDMFNIGDRFYLFTITSFLVVQGARDDVGVLSVDQGGSTVQSCSWSVGVQAVAEGRYSQHSSNCQCGSEVPQRQSCIAPQQELQAGCDEEASSENNQAVILISLQIGCSDSDGGYIFTIVSEIRHGSKKL